MRSLKSTKRKRSSLLYEKKGTHQDIKKCRLRLSACRSKARRVHEPKNRQKAGCAQASRDRRDTRQTYCEDLDLVTGRGQWSIYYFPKALYYVISRGNQNQDIFLDDKDLKAFLAYLSEYKIRFPFHLRASQIHPSQSNPGEGGDGPRKISVDKLSPGREGRCQTRGRIKRSVGCRVTPLPLATCHLPLGARH